MSAQRGTIVDLFAGPGGWSEGLRMLGLSDIGIEWDRDACLTRRAAGHLTVRADVSQYPPEVFRGAWGLIASPPCQDFSLAGKRAGRGGKRGELVDAVPAWVQVVRPEWVVCEQVPGVLDIWHEHAYAYRDLGYSTWCGILNAADFGVPQDRTRAVLMAQRAASVSVPAPTHTDGEVDSLFGMQSPWLSIESVSPGRAGWDLEHIRGAGMLDRHGERPPRTSGDIAFTVMAWKDSRMRWRHPDGRTERFDLADSLRFQGFPAGYPVAGSQTSAQKQIGNAVPPLLAAHVLSAVTGVPMPAAQLEHAS